MKETFYIFITLLLLGCFVFLFSIYEEIERLESQIKTDAAILQDTKTISNNWKMMAYQAVEIAKKQKVEIETLRK